jgi:nucleotide-binding universal stress UspA family protein
MFDKVIVGVDGSASGREALALAGGLLEPGGRLTLAHVEVGLSGVTYTLYPAGRDDSQRLLQDARAAGGVQADLVTVSAPSVGHGLHALAEEHEAELLVLGSCRRGVMGRILVGDDTRDSLNGAPCAVAIAPRGYVARPGGFRAVGVGYDFSGESHRAMTVARELAHRNGAVLRALRVVAQPVGSYASPMPGNWGELMEHDLKDAEARLKSIEDVEGTAVYGVAGEELAAFGDRVDLLVVGSRSYGPMRRMIFGSTSSRLARHARCPLLVLPRTADTALAVPDDHGPLAAVDAQPAAREAIAATA